MSEEQVSALLARLQDDPEFQKKIHGATDLDHAVSICIEEGFDVSKADLLKTEAKHTLELSDEELEGVSGGSLLVFIAGSAGIFLGSAGAAGGAVVGTIKLKHKLRGN